MFDTWDLFVWLFVVNKSTTTTSIMFFIRLFKILNISFMKDIVPDFGHHRLAGLQKYTFMSPLGERVVTQIKTVSQKRRIHNII